MLKNEVGFAALNELWSLRSIPVLSHNYRCFVVSFSVFVAGISTRKVTIEAIARPAFRDMMLLLQRHAFFEMCSTG